MANGHDDGGRRKDTHTERANGSGGRRDGHDGAKDDSTDGSSTSNVVSRRSALKLAGLGALAGVGSPMLSGEAAAATVYDAVDDLGWDPDGNEPVQDSLGAAYGNNVTIQVPPGTYRVNGLAFKGSADNFTLEGTGSDHRDAQFLADAGYRGKLFVHWGGSNFTLRNVSLNQRDDTETSLEMTAIGPDGILIEDVETLGFTPDDSHTGGAGYQLAVGAESSSGTATVRRYYNREGGQISTYPNRQIGIWVAGGHSGVLNLEDLVLIELGGSSIYGTRHNGTVRVEGGYYANNDHHDMRISNERSDKLGWVRDAVFFGDYDHCVHSKAGHEGGEGWWIEHGTDDLLVENCDFVYRDTYPTNPDGAHFPGIVQIRNYSGNVEFRNCRFHNDVTSASPVTGPSIRADDGSLTVNNSHFTGDSPRAAVDCNVSGSVSDSAIEMPNSPGVVGASTSNVSTSGATVASIRDLASVYTGNDSIPDSGDGSGNDSGGSDEPSLPNTIELVGTGTTTYYEFTVSGELQSTSALEPWDAVSGLTGVGYVTDGTDRDAFEFEGEVTDLTFHEGEARVFVNGTEVDPSTLGEPDLPHTIELVGTGTTTNYEVTVSGELQGADDSVESWDAVSGSTATGYVTDSSDRDAFDFEGEVTDLTFHEGEATVLLDGTEVDPVNLGADGLPNTIEVVGTGVTTNYEFTVSGELEGADDSIESWDQISGSTATGYVTDSSDRDAFDFEGEVTDLTFHRGEAQVFVNGSEVEP